MGVKNEEVGGRRVLLGRVIGGRSGPRRLGGAKQGGARGPPRSQVGGSTVG